MNAMQTGLVPQSELTLEEADRLAKMRALARAKSQEQITDRRHYVIRTVGPERWVVTDRMPMLGEWYDADGYRHG